jgi:WD40-like Beta Propeller Repeat
MFHTEVTAVWKFTIPSPIWLSPILTETRWFYLRLRRIPPY